MDEKKVRAAAEAVDNAMLVVARTAQEVSDGAVPIERGFTVDAKPRTRRDAPSDGWFISNEEMAELRDALAGWKTATNDFLAAQGGA